MEAVKYQVNPRLFLGLVEIYTALLEKGKKGEVVLADMNPVSDLIKKEVDMQVRMLGSKADSYDAFTIVPDLDANNPIAQDMWRWVRNSEDGIRKINQAKTAVRGTVDLDSGRLGGVFTQVQVDICIGCGWFNKKQFCTAEELAAITLHEIGHPFTYFEMLSEVVTTNIVLSALAQDWLMADRTKRTKLLDAVNANSQLEIDPRTRDQLASVDDTDGVIGILCTGEFFKPRSMFETDGNDFSGWEAASDQFAIRHGAGGAIGTSLIKLNQYSPASYRKTRVNGVLADLTSLFCLGAVGLGGALTIALGPVGLAYTAVAAMIMVGNIIGNSNYTFDIYDTPRKRIERIIIQTRGHLREKDLPKEQVQRTLKVMEELEASIANLSKGNRLFEGLVNTVFRSRGREIDIRRRQEIIESLGNNELYAVSAALRNK